MKPVIRVCILFLALLSGCSSAEKAEEAAVIWIGQDQQLQEIPFTNGAGHAITVFEPEGAVNCIVSLRELDPEKKYTIELGGKSVSGSNGGVVMFGPAENVVQEIGTVEKGTLFVPNAEGELFVSMRNPIRMLESQREMTFTVRSEDGRDVIRTVPFVKET